MNDHLKAKKEELLRLKDIFSDCLQLQQHLESPKLTVQNVNSIPSSDLGLNLCLNVHRPSPPVKKLNSKYSPSEIESNPTKHARVIITTSMQPGEIYVQIDDENLPRFHQMQKELQEEFRSASKASTSYLSTPLVGSYIIFHLTMTSASYFIQFIFQCRQCLRSPERQKWRMV